MSASPIPARDGSRAASDSPSKETVEKARLTKMLIESHYQNLAQEKEERSFRWERKILTWNIIAFGELLHAPDLCTRQKLTLPLLLVTACTTCTFNCHIHNHHFLSCCVVYCSGSLALFRPVSMESIGCAFM